MFLSKLTCRLSRFQFAFGTLPSAVELQYLSDKMVSHSHKTIFALVCFFISLKAKQVLLIVRVYVCFMLSDDALLNFYNKDFVLCLTKQFAAACPKTGFYSPLFIFNHSCFRGKERKEKKKEKAKGRKGKSQRPNPKKPSPRRERHYWNRNSRECTCPS